MPDSHDHDTQGDHVSQEWPQEVRRLQAELAGLRLALDTLGVYIYTKDLAGRYAYANRLVCELFGVPLAAVQGREDGDFFDFSQSVAIWENDQRVLEAGETLEREERNVIKATGELRSYWSVKAPLRDDLGQIVGLCGLSLDITDRRANEQKLAEYRQLIDIVLDNVDAHIYLKDREGRYRYVNPKVSDLFRRPEVEILGHSDAELFPPELAGEFKRLDDQVFATGGRQASEERLIDPDGRPHHFWSVKLPLRRAGQGDCLIGFSTEISELKKAQAAMARSEARFRALFEASSEAVMVLGPDYFIDCNPAALRLFGLPSREGLIGIHPAELSPPLQPDGVPSVVAAATQIASALRTGSLTFDWVHRRADTGQDFPSEVTLSAIDLESERVLLSTVRDLGPRLRQEEALRAAREAMIRHESEQRLGAFVDQGLAGISEIDLQGRLVHVNDRYCAIVGQAREDLIGRHLSDFTSAEDWARERTLLEALLRGEGSGIIEKCYRRRDGGLAHALVTIALARDVNGQPSGFLGLVTDISQRKEVEARLRHSEELARRQLTEIQAYYDTAPVGLFVLDTELRYLRINERLAAINGQPVAAHLGRTVREILPDLADSVEPIFRNIIATGEPLLNVEINEASASQPGGQRVWRAHYYPLRNPAGDIIGLNGTAEDITDLKRAERHLRESEQRYRELSAELELKVEARTAELRGLNAKLNQLATTDALTGVWNRRYFEEAAEVEIARARRDEEPLTLLMFDIDHFKAINDRLGHQAGDRVLVEVTRRIQSHLRAVDVLGRWGGEEFIVLLPRCGGGDVFKVAEKLRALLADPPIPEIGVVTASFGIGELMPEEHFAHWLKRVDDALYQAKAAGRNRVCLAGPEDVATGASPDGAGDN